MMQGRMPAQIVDTFCGEENNLSSSKTTEAIIPHNDGACQVLPWPNYCGHLPNQPEFFSPPKTHKQRSKIITETMQSLEVAYFDPQAKLASIQNHIDTGDQVKSPRREAVIRILQVMLYYVDDASGRVGRRLQDGRFEDLSVSKLAALANLRLKRAKRAMKDIIKSGYLFVTRQFQRARNGDIFALPSMKEFTPKFFMELDIKGKLWQGWFALKNWKKEREAKKEYKTDKKKAKAVMGLISETLKNASKGAKRTMSRVAGIVKGIPAPKAGKSQAALNHERKLRDAAMALYRADPTPSLTDYYKQLLEKYPTPP